MQKRTRAIAITASMTVAGIALGATIATAASGSNTKVPALQSTGSRYVFACVNPGGGIDYLEFRAPLPHQCWFSGESLWYWDAVPLATSGTTPTPTPTVSPTPTVTATAITSLVTANGSSGTVGKLNAGDTITIQFSGQINASKVCSAWTNASTVTQSTSAGSVITVSNTGTGDNILSFTTAPSACTTFNFASIDLGSSQYVTSTSADQSATFTTSTISYNGTTDTLVITLGTAGGQGTENVVSSSVLKLTLSTSILDTAGNPLSSYTFTTASGQQF